LFIYSPIDGHLSSLHVLAVMNKTGINFMIARCFPESMFSFRVCLENCQVTVSSSALTAVNQSSYSLTSLPTSGVVRILDFVQCKCAMIAHCFNLLFPDDI
jgi:hypothetical protein